MSIGWAVWSWTDRRKRRASEVLIFDGGVLFRRGRNVRFFPWHDVEDVRPLGRRGGRPSPPLNAVRAGAAEEMPSQWVVEIGGGDDLLLDLRHWRDPIGMMRQFSAGMRSRQ